jgi:4-amino-4-deoxy-L-arabinose transferase-like glycosyltransferase
VGTVTTRADAPEAEARRRVRIDAADGTLAAIAVLAAVLAAWGIGHRTYHYYYGAAVRSMSQSWHAFLYGSLDPSSFISVDKLPGALWPQALAVRIFGFHGWAMALPEILAFVGSVLLLARIVRLWAGRPAGLVAAAAYATTPVVVALARTTIPDTLLVFFLLFAAERLWTGLESGRRRDLVLCGVLLGAAFNVKMLQALLVLPAFGLLYAVWGPRDARRRTVDLLAGAAGLAVTAVVWIVVVTLTPAGDRPWVAGTEHNSAIDLVVRYDGLDRFRSGEQHLPFGGLAGPTRLFNDELGSQIGWLLPVAVLALVLALWRVGAGRIRGGYAFWGLWLAIHAIAFSFASYGIHPYYTAALAPAVAALVGAGVLAARSRSILIAYLVVACASAWVVTSGADALRWVPFVVTAGAAVVALALWLERLPRARYAVAAVLLVAPALWALDTLRQPQTFWGAVNPVAGPLAGGTDAPGPIAPVADLRRLADVLRTRAGSRYVAATTDGLTASPLISTFGLRVLPLGGLSGSDPAPSPTALQALVAAGAFHLVVYRSPAPTPHAVARSDWLRQHCRAVPNTHLRALATMHARLLSCG